MNKMTMPVLLVATIMVAGAFAFVPVEQASTVHQTAGGSNSIHAAVSTTLLLDTVLNDVKAMPTMDVHNQVSEGYITINTSTANAAIANVANLQCGAFTAAGAEVGTSVAVTLLAGVFSDTNRNTYHCHIPSAAGTILVGLVADGAAVTIPDGSIITTTIDELS